MSTSAELVHTDEQPTSGHAAAKLAAHRSLQRRHIAADVLGERIRSLREGAHLSQAEVMAPSGKSAAYLSRIESGERKPSLATLETIATGLRVDLDMLLGVDGPDEDAEPGARPRAAAAHEVALTAAAWLREPTKPQAFSEFVRAVNTWEWLTEHGAPKEEQ